MDKWISVRVIHPMHDLVGLYIVTIATIVVYEK